ncbi:conserved hypothetical protein [Ricinus communis]|uniref:O-acyltransferase WSD1 C-terminal domain-containing protein n=1 Tax=Ricinus communis TaxID=3988 RepID=B9RVX5_RICCO|nr:conserved hypothetical protein [Ricinus communis]
MEAMRPGSGKARTTSLVLLNTRMLGGYKSVQEMVKPNAEFPWGNNFSLLSVSISKLSSSEIKDPLQFIRKVRKIIQKKRSSFAAVSKHFHGVAKNTSLTISNLMGPIEPMALANRPVKGLYFVVAGTPQSLVTGVISYMGRLRVAALVEKDFMDPQKFKSHVEDAFGMIFKAACGAPSPTC